MSGVQCVRNIADVRSVLDEVRARGDFVGLVPTMGALHEGHLSLIRKAREENGFVVVSVFVNPTQFNASEDLRTYPRDLERDLALALDAGADLVFSPAAEEMYREDFSTWVEVGGLTEGLCGAARPGHFRGVCTVVTKLFNICRPDRAYFGQKDAQQLAVIRRMVRDLDMPIEIVACPIVREADGLAMSSRNARLSAEERGQAPILFRALSRAITLVENGERQPRRVRDEICAVIGEAGLAKIDYVEIVDAESLRPVETLRGSCLIAVAVWFGATRLIDNVGVTV
jgi:pantoate--beta-alanine ligase